MTAHGGAEVIAGGAAGRVVKPARERRARRQRARLAHEEHESFLHRVLAQRFIAEDAAARRAHQRSVRGDDARARFRCEFRVKRGGIGGR